MHKVVAYPDLDQSTKDYWEKLYIDAQEMTGCLKYGVMAHGYWEDDFEVRHVNGSPRGTKDSKDIGNCYRVEKFGSDSNKYRNVGCRAIHAEQQVILEAMQYKEHYMSLQFGKGILNVTAHPCNMCAKMIAHSGLFQKVVYLAPKMDQLSIDILENAGIEVVCIVGAPFGIGLKDY